MSLSEMKEQSFPDYEFNEWKKTAEDSLKGKPLESLQRTTYEGINLKPLYTSEDLQAVSQFPGGEDFRRGNNPLGYLTNIWKIAQRISADHPEDLKEKLKQALDSGQNALSFDISSELIETKGFLENLFLDYAGRFPLALNASQYQPEVFSALESTFKTKEEREAVSGYAAADPLSDLVVSGYIPEQFSEALDEFSNNIKKANEKFPNLRMVLVNTTPYHNGGANAVQELGIAAAAGVFYLNSLKDLTHEQLLNKLIFKFSVGSNYFMEIAKLRAARVIWNKVAEVYGEQVQSRGMQIAAETSLFTKTLFDPYVNLLRGGNEAFAAVTGGVQYLHVNAHDQLTGASSFSERIARNIQLILQEEAHLKKVIDPAGGSWYIESLTNELAQKAWEFFQTIEAKGGILEAIKSNWLQREISAVYEKREKDVFNRKQSIIGTNVYANLDDACPEVKDTQSEKSKKGEFSIDVTPIPQIRLSQPYEELRVRSSVLQEKTGQKPSVGLICLGSLKQHKARLDFVRGFLSAGGVTVSSSDSIDSAEQAINFIKESDTNYFCICGTNEQYQILGYEIFQAIKSKLGNRSVLLAGLPEKEDQAKWIENGLKQFIHVKSNCFETLSSILSEMEVSVNEQIQA